MRITLPGSQKYKRILLIICTIIAIGVIINEGIKNKKYNDDIEKNKAKIEQQKKIEDEDRKKIEEKTQNKVKELETKNDKAYELFHSKKYDDAINIANEIIEEDSNNYKAYNIRGITKAYKYRDLDKALEDINKALEIKNEYGYARFNKALTYELLGKYDDALVWYDKALKVEDYVWTYYGIASIYGRRGDVDNTVKYLKVAIDKNSQIKETAKNEEDFNPVKDNEAFKKLLN